MDEERALNARELAQILGVSTSTVYAGANSGDLPGFKVGRRWRFWLSQVREHLDRQTRQRDPWARSKQSRAAHYREASRRLRQGSGTREDATTIRDYLERS